MRPGFGGAELLAGGGLGGFAETDFASCLGVLVAELLDVVCLAEGLGADGAEGGGEGFAVFGVALLYWGETGGLLISLDVALAFSCRFPATRPRPGWLETGSDLRRGAG